jgi:predicted TIM-barrel fold metal-dependent hydrolase
VPDARDFATRSAPLCAGPNPEIGGPARFNVPPGAVDTHAHVLGLPPRYPLEAGRSYTAPEATPAAYLSMLEKTGMTHGVLVQPSVHGTDNRLAEEALVAHRKKLRGVAVVAPDVTDRVLTRLDEAGFRGCRFNIMFGGGIGLDAIGTLAKKIKPFGWHMQFLMDVRKIGEVAKQLSSLPVPWVIDHMGYVPTDEGVNNAGFRTLLSMLKDGNGWVKLSGAFRVSSEGPPYRDTIPFAQALVAARPDRMLWGSDWPHVAIKPPMPKIGDLLDLFAEWVPDEATRKRIFVDNPHKLYGFGDTH